MAPGSIFPCFRQRFWEHRTQFLTHLRGRDQFLTGKVPAFLRHDLIFEMQHRGAGFFPQLDRALCIEQYQHRRKRVPRSDDVLEHFGLREHPEVGRTRHDRGGYEAAYVDCRASACSASFALTAS